MTARFDTYTGVPSVLFTDLDGTLTTAGRLDAATYQAMASLAGAGLPIVIVTGRPAGWGDAMVRLWPVAAVIAENGAVSLVRSGDRVKRRFGHPEEHIPALRRKMLAAVDDVRRDHPGARLSADSRFREVDLAIDWNEEASLPIENADRIAWQLRAEGFEATRSSVHVNFGPVGVDKLTACRAYVSTDELESYLYIGDALNDAPMFAGFPHSVGVANVRDVWDALPHKPRYVTDAAEGAGFCEVAEALLRRLRG